MHKTFITLSLASLALSPPARAAGASDAIADDPVIVTATRDAQPISRIGQSVTVLDAAAIRLSQMTAVSDLLLTTPGISAARNGGIGGVTGVFIRGAEGYQTTVLIDGVKLNEPSAPSGGFDFGNLLTGNLERIEILRGPQSVLWGSQAIGGVVNMITAEPTADWTFAGHAEGGSLGTANIVGNVAGRTGRVALSAGGGYFRTDGISAFNARRGGVERDGYANAGAHAKVVVDLGAAVSLDLRAYLSRGRSAIDGFPPPNFTFADAPDVSRSREIVGYAGLNVALFDGRLRNRFAYAHTDIRRHNIDPTLVPETTFLSSGRAARLEYQGILDVTDGVRLTAGAERETTRSRTAFPSPFDLDPVPARGRARLTSVYGQLIVSPVKTLTVTGGVRHDHHSVFGNATTFSASAVWSPHDGATRLRASYGDGFNAPTLFQLLSDYGNTRLRPETAKSWDMGVEQHLLEGRLVAGLAYFQRRTRDQIDFISCFGDARPICVDRPFGTYDNVARTRAQGLEMTLGLRPVDGLRIDAQYSWLDPRNRAAGSANFDNVLARRARHSASVRADYTAPGGIGGGFTLTRVGAKYDDAGNARRLGAYTLFDLRARYPVMPGVELYGRIENLFDEAYESSFEYGVTGRTAFLGVRAHL